MASSTTAQPGGNGMPNESTPRIPSRHATPQPPPGKHGWIWFLVLAAVAYAGWHYRAKLGIGGSPASASATTGSTGTGGGRGGRGATGPVPVVVYTAKTGSVPVYLRAPGTAVPNYTVAIHTRVDGQIMSVHFDEGQFVKKGDLLVEIDPRPFQVQLAQAVGSATRDQALLSDAKLNYERYLSLYNQKIIPKQQLDTQDALVAQYQGAIATDLASEDSAKLNIAYCQVTAPITGRIGLRKVDPGNIIHASDANGLAIITQVQPIAVMFSLPQQTLPAVYGQLRQNEHPPVVAFDGTDSTKELASGTLLTIDDAIDTTTLTYQSKAMFNNSDFALFPNQFVNVRLQTGTDSGLILVPPAAIQRGPQGTYVFVVTPAQKATVRNVTVAITEGNEAGISQGLSAGENVVVDGADRLEEGTPVQASLQAPNGKVTPAAPVPAAGKAGRAGHKAASGGGAQ